MKTILITGASSGIGLASAQRFQAEGWNVAATMRNPAHPTPLQGLANLALLRMDVTERASIDAAVAATIEQFGGLDVLLNNAGYGLAGPLEALTPEQLERQFATNVYGPIYTTQACLPHFRAQGEGVIINVTSIGGRLVFPYFTAYHGTKFALEGLSESLAFELAPLGIRVKLVEPGGVKTDFAGRSLDRAQHEAYADSMKRVFAAFADPERAQNYSEPTATAAVIFQAATDGTAQLRYLAGADAIAMAAARAQTTDEAYREFMLQRFNL